MGATLGTVLGLPVDALWSMRNGYALCTCAALDAITDWIGSSMSEQIDGVRGKLKVRVHRDDEVTDSIMAEEVHGSVLSQAFCSALPARGRTGYLESESAFDSAIK